MKRIIHYDLHHKDSDDYQDLYDVLEGLGGAKITESVYMINTDETQKSIYSKILKAVHKDDDIFYISVNKDNKLFCDKIA